MTIKRVSTNSTGEESQSIPTIRTTDIGKVLSVNSSSNLEWASSGASLIQSASFSSVTSITMDEGLSGYSLLTLVIEASLNSDTIEVRLNGLNNSTSYNYSYRTITSITSGSSSNESDSMILGVSLEDGVYVINITKDGKMAMYGSGNSEGYLAGGSLNSDSTSISSIRLFGFSSSSGSYTLSGIK